MEDCLHKTSLCWVFPQAPLFPARAAPGFRRTPGRLSSISRGLILLLIGSLEPIPGPHQYSCSACGLGITRSHRSVLCNSCLLWTLKKCSHLPEFGDYTEEWSYFACNCSPAPLPLAQPGPLPCPFPIPFSPLFCFPSSSPPPYLLPRLDISLYLNPFHTLLNS